MDGLEPISLIDVGLATVTGLLLLFSPQLGVLGPVATTAITALILALHVRSLPKSVASSWLVFIMPGLAFVSYLWSIDRDATMYYGVQYLITVLLGFAVGALLKRDSALIGLFLAWATFSCANIVLGKSVGAGAHGEKAFSGLTEAKNFFGDTSTLGAITSVVTLIIALNRRWIVMALFAAGVLLLQLYSVRMAFSTGSVLGIIEAGTVIFLLLLAKSVPLRARYLAASVIALAILVIAAFWGQLSDLGAHIAQDVLHKDATLTGRTVIWDAGRALVHERPTLGAGFYAFWRQGNLDAEGIWRANGIVSRAGFNFHSTSLEILVELGSIGLFAFFGLMGIYGVRLVVRSLAILDAAALYWCAILVYELGRMPYEAVGLGTYGYATVLLFGAFVAGGHKPRMAAPARSPSVRYWRSAKSFSRQRESGVHDD